MCVIGVACHVCHTCGIAVNHVVCHWWGMAREDLHFRLRIPEALKAKIEAAASENHRSMTAEIIDRLELTFDAEKIRPDATTMQRALADAARIAEQAAKDAKYNNKVLEWMQEQQSVMFELLRAVADGDGHLSPDFMRALKQAVYPRNDRDTGFPQPPAKE